MKRRGYVATVITLAILAPAVARARPGDLDPTWNGAGIAVTNLGSGSDLAQGIARQSDGKIVVVGGSGAQYVVRYATDGTLDPTFGSGGVVATGWPCTPPAARAVAIDASGRIVVAATACNDWLVTRYDAAGALDPTFGVAGIADIPIASDRVLQGLALQADGKIVLAGYRRVDSQPNILLVRLDAAGGLDAGFGAGGYVDTIRTTDDEAQDVVQQADGKLVVLALTDDGPTVLRYDDGGTIDPSFGTAGAVVIPVPELTHLTLAPDGRILAIGRGTVAPTKAIIVRLLANGDLDPSFGGTGIVQSSLGGTISDAGTGLVVQPDGKLVLLARSDPTAFHWDIVLARYFDDGNLDTTFGVAGVARTPVGGTSLVTEGGIVLEPDGKLVVAGTRGSTVANFDFEIVRYLGGTCGDGVLDGGETCDDRDTLATACCSALCEAAPAGTACEDDSAICHTDDTCDGAGACTHVAAPLGGCKPVAPGGGHLTARTSPASLTWKWAHGAATTIGEFADPLATDAYALCAYAGPSATPVLETIAGPAARAAGTRAGPFAARRRSAITIACARTTASRRSSSPRARSAPRRRS
jgi:uncharacterized delta-60 repeat protein